MAQSDGVVPCGYIGPHEPHRHILVFSGMRCPGIPEGTEYHLHVSGVRSFTDLRDLTAPMLRKMFPGVIVDVDERVIVSTVPNVPWRGARIDVYGLEWGTAHAIEGAIHGEYAFVRDGDPDYDPWNRNGVEAMTDEETERVRQHRFSK